MNVHLLLLHVQVLVSEHEVYANVHWEVQSYPVVFEESVMLYCNTSSVQDECEACTRRWYGGKSEDWLAFNGLALDHSKYDTIEDSNGFGLVIKHFNEADVNKLYICTIGFYSDENKLQLPNDFEIQPKKESLNVIQNVNSGSMLNLQVDFKKVHPPPRCIIYLNGDNLSSKLIANQQKEGIFYRVTVDFQHNLKPSHCIGKLELTCTIGTRNTTFASLDLNSLCKDVHRPQDYYPPYDNSMHKQSTMGIVVVAVFSVMMFFAVVVAICYRHIFKILQHLRGRNETEMRTPNKLYTNVSQKKDVYL